MQSSTNEQNDAPSATATATEVLVAGIERSCLEPLTGLLKTKAVDDSHAESLLALLQEIGIDFSLAYHVLADTQDRHCVRCHQTYQERTNGPKACFLYVQRWRSFGDESESDEVDTDHEKTGEIRIEFWHTVDMMNLLWYYEREQKGKSCGICADVGKESDAASQ